MFDSIDAVLPRTPWVLIRRARCYLAQANREQAITDLLAAFDLAADDLLARLEILAISSETGDWNSLIRALRDLPAHSPECWALVAFRIRAWMELGRWNEALGDLAGMAETTPGDDNLLICQTLVHMVAKNEDGHRRLRRELLARAASSASSLDALPLLGALLTVPIDDLDAPRILALLEIAVADSPENVRLVGAALYRNGQFAAAVEAFSNAAHAGSPRTPPQQARDHFFLAMAHQRLGQADLAREQLRLGAEMMSALPTLVAPVAHDPETVLTGWCTRTALQHLRQEAEQVIER